MNARSARVRVPVPLVLLQSTTVLLQSTTHVLLPAIGFTLSRTPA